MWNTLLLDSNASGTDKGTTRKEILLVKRTKRNSFTHLELYTRQFCPACTYLSQGLAPLILILMFPWYLSDCFPLAFLEDHYFFSFSEIISLCLDPILWDPSALSLKAVSSASTLSWSHWRYSNFFFFFFFFFSTIFYFSASSLVLAFASFLVFWATCLTQQASSASSNQASYCSSSCFHCISCYCSLSILASFKEMSEKMEKNIVIQKKKQKLLFFVYILLT